jgi:transcriptional regulator with XRE-family HTH domain
MLRDDVRRQELRDFLKTRRARVSPTDVGLVVAGRRRTSGLRREDVASLAGVSATWYTWLEQGRPVKASSQLLENLARIFRLSPTEQLQLYHLAARQPPLNREPLQEQVSPLMERLMEQMGTIPALILGRRWDVLASNQALRSVLFDFDSLPPNERNILWFFFAHPVARSLDNWEPRARAALARFRFDYGRHAGDPDFIELVDRLKAASLEFAAWWPSQEVLPQSEGRAEFMHGSIFADHITLLMAENTDLKLILLIPDAASLGKIEKLLMVARPAVKASKATRRRAHVEIESSRDHMRSV